MDKLEKWVLTPLGLVGIGLLIKDLWSGKLDTLGLSVVTFLLLCVALTWVARYFKPEDCTCDLES